MSDARSGDPLFRSGDDLRISDWNRAAEELTGIPPEEAVGSYCWDVIRGRSADGELICHAGCSIARLARQGWPVRCQELHMQTPLGQKVVSISTIVVREGGEQLILHPLRETEPAAPPRERPVGPVPELTRRQLEILRLLAEGLRAKEIAERLVLSETTVRNHIRAVLLELGAHSQLEAVAKARRFELVAEALSA